MSSPNSTNYLSQIKSLDENFYSYIIIGLAFIILIIFIGYLIYLSRLQKSECNYMDKLYPSVNGNVRPITSTDPYCSRNLNDYYIQTAYNACSGGSYRNDYVDLCNLKAVIKQGVRCLDFEIYSIDNEPVVATSTSDNYHVKETFNSVSFASVMDIIKNYAFAGGACPNPTDPLILHLRCKSNNQKMYSKLAEIFKSNNDIMLGMNYSFMSKENKLLNAPLLTLKNKVILIIDNSNKAFLNNDKLLEYVNLTSDSIVMRIYNYSKIENIEDKGELTKFNEKGMTIVIPDNTSSPPNPSGKVCMETGCQLVAMRYQLADDNLKENIKFFNEVGYAFALKPKEQRVKEDVNASPK
jgi:hypothetical protein